MKNRAGRTFEEAMQRLEAIVGQLEASSSSLEESLALYEEGKELVNFCLAKLDSAEQKLKTLSPADEIESDK